MKCSGPQRSLCIWLSALLCVGCAHGQTPGKQVTAVGAQLLRSVHSATMREGDTFFLSTVDRWQQANCLVAEKTEIAGRVLHTVRDPRRASDVSVDVRFAPVSCSGRPEEKVLPVLVAIRGVKPVEDSALRRLSTAALEDNTIANMFSPPRPGVPTSVDTRLTSANALPVMNWGGFAPQSDIADLKTGQVDGVRGLELRLPANDPSTTLVFSRNVTLRDREVTLVLALVPEPVRLPGKGGLPLQPRALARSTAGATPTQARSAEETEVCAQGGCRFLANPAAEVGSGVLWTVALPQLGFQDRPDERLRGFRDGASVHFLGDDQVLFTFTEHALIRRDEMSGFGVKPRKVRGVLVSRQSGQVLKILDWQVSDGNGPYVWDLDGQHLLVHRGNELVEIGPDFEANSRVALPGPISFLSIAPQGELLLLATVHEKHSAEEHAALGRFLGPDEPIDENYDLTALDSHLHVVSTRLLFALPVQPAILRSAMVDARQGRANHWQIASTTWAGTRMVLANVVSTCAVRVRALPNHLLFVQGCVPNQLQSTWYRVLRDTGATLLKGEKDSYAVMQQAGMDAKGDEFALAASHPKEPLPVGVPVRAGDLTNETVDVYRAETGKLLFATHLTPGSPEQESFALAPDGNALAVFTTGELRLYRLGAATSGQAVSEAKKP